MPQLRCWARMISCGKYTDKDTIPSFLELDNQPKKSKRTSLAEAIAGAAVTFANAVAQFSVSGDFLQRFTTTDGRPFMHFNPFMPQEYLPAE